MFRLYVSRQCAAKSFKKLEFSTLQELGLRCQHLLWGLLAANWQSTQIATADWIDRKPLSARRSLFTIFTKLHKAIFVLESLDVSAVASTGSTRSYRSVLFCCFHLLLRIQYLPEPADAKYAASFPLVSI